MPTVYLKHKWSDNLLGSLDQKEELLFQKDDLAEWMRESLEGAVADVVEADWSPPSSEPVLCEQSPRAEGDTTVMQRALCPWETK